MDDKPAVVKVLLVQPRSPVKCPTIEHLYLDEPLALEYLAADLPEKATARILDLRIGGNILEEMLLFQPDIVGLTGYTLHSQEMMSICRQVKRVNPNTLTVVGGHHATVSPQDFETPGIDVIVIGDGVPALREMVQKLQSGEDFSQVKGLSYRKDGKFIRTAPRPPTPLDDYPLPDRSLTREYRKMYHGEWMQPAASTRTSRGCAFRCNFCAVWRVTGGKYMTRSVDNIIKELKIIEEKYIMFNDDESFIDTKRMEKLAQAIEDNGIHKTYIAYARSDSIVQDTWLFERWKKVGLHTVIVGLEFCTQNDLDFVNKKTSLETNNKAIAILKEIGINLAPLFMVRPDFEEKDFREFAAYVKKLDLEAPTFSVLTPLPGTELQEQVKDKMLNVGHEYTDFVHTLLPTKMSFRDFYYWYHWLYRNSTSTKRDLIYLSKYGWRRMLPMAWKNARVLGRVKEIYKDY